MKMSEKTLLKKIEQAFAENYCNGSYKLDILHEDTDVTYYVLYYTYKTGETISVNIENSWLGEVEFYSHVHGYYISNFNNHIKSVINVLRMLFDMIDSNKDIMIKYNEIEPEETEETVKDIMEVKQSLNERFGKEQCVDTDTLQPNETIIAKIEEINYCPNQNKCCAVSPYVQCDYKYKSEACIKAHKNFIHSCEQVHKQLKAIHNPEWHNVSLATLANIDFDMLDEKRQLYLSLYIEIKELLKDLHNCKSGRSYEKRLAKMHSRCADLVYENKVTSDYIRYVTRKVSMCNVECGLWPSANEVSTGYHKSRRYNHLTIRY